MDSDKSSLSKIFIFENWGEGKPLPNCHVASLLSRAPIASSLLAASMVFHFLIKHLNLFGLFGNFMSSSVTVLIYALSLSLFFSFLKQSLLKKKKKLLQNKLLGHRSGCLLFCTALDDIQDSSLLC